MIVDTHTAGERASLRAFPEAGHLGHQCGVMTNVAVLLVVDELVFEFCLLKN